MPHLMDLSDEARFAMYGDLADAGGYIAGYGSEAMTVAAPSDWRRYLDAIYALGYRTDGTLTYFPIGGDNPPETMRHWGPNTSVAPRGTVPSYWCYVRVYPKES